MWWQDTVLKSIKRNLKVCSLSAGIYTEDSPNIPYWQSLSSPLARASLMIDDLELEGGGTPLASMSPSVVLPRNPRADEPVIEGIASSRVGEGAVQDFEASSKR